MVVVDLGQSRWRIVEKKQKSPTSFAILVVLHGQPPFDGRMLSLPPIWLIDADLHRFLEVLKEFGRRMFLTMVLRRHLDGAMVSFWSF